MSSSASAQMVFSNGMLTSGAFAQSGGEPDTRDFAVIPLVGLQETFTDNAFVTSTDKQYDFITRPMLGAEVRSQGGPLVGTVAGHIFYDAYAREGGLSGLSGDAQGQGTYSLIPNFLQIDAEGVLTNTYLSTFDVAATDRVGPQNRLQLTTYDIGPHLTTVIDDFADLNVMGRFAQVFFENPNVNAATTPEDSTILQGSATLDTGTRYVGYQSISSIQYARDDHGFESYDGLQSFFVRILPEARLVGRGGYDAVTQAGVVDIHAPIWSGGIELDINQLSHITVETGERFNHSAWTSDVRLQFSDRLFATGRYTESLEPDQVQINTSFTDFVTQTTELPTQLTQNNFSLNGNFNDQVSLNKLADFHMVYNWEGDNIDFQADWEDRLFVAANQHDRTLLSGITYGRMIAQDLRASATVNYWRTFSNPVFGSSELFGGTLSLQYDLNPTMRLYGGYTYQNQQQLFVTGQTIVENVAFAAITKRF